MIDKEKFSAYEDVRQSGVTNMFDLKTVCELADPTRDEAKEIMRNYSKLKEKYSQEKTSP